MTPPRADIDLDDASARARVRAEVERRGLVPVNRTRWQALVDAVRADLPFPPAFQLQTVLGPREALIDPEAVNYWGDWEALEPFWEIEWVRVIPRWRKPVGRLVADEVVDVGDAFRDLLGRLGIAFRADDGGTVWIYGYAPADPATLTETSETLT